MIIYDTKNGYIKKYRHENEMWLLSVLECTYRVIVYIWFNYPVNGRRK